MVQRIAKVAVNVPGISRQFDYQIPDGLLGKLRAGQLVNVPFGAQQVQAIIITLCSQSQYPELKEIANVYEEKPVVTDQQIALASYLSEKYYSPLSANLVAMLPPGLAQWSDTQYSLKTGWETHHIQLTKVQNQIIQSLEEKGPLRSRQLQVLYRHTNWKASIHALQKKKIIESQPILPEPKIKPKKIRTIGLHHPIADIADITPDLGRKGSAASMRRKKIMQALMKNGGEADAAYLYAASGANAADIRYLEKKEIIRTFQEPVIRDPIEGFLPEGTHRPSLTHDQQQAWHTIEREMRAETPKPVLMRGVTGSGKTEIYLRVAENVTRSHQQVVVLVPEISLTPQTISRFLDRFPGTIGVIHSKLSLGERYDTWRRIRSGKITVVIGARSAIFSPFSNLGAVIIDECHDDSYYQDDFQPIYDAIDAGLYLGKQNKKIVILGSATPNVTQYYFAKQNEWPIIELTKRITGFQNTTVDEPCKDSVKPVQFSALPPVQIVDMRKELSRGNRSILSAALISTLRDVVKQKQQAILFLNRRGSATVVFCRDCGTTLACPRCEFPLTYHSDTSKLMCHTCGYSRNKPKRCPACGSGRIRQYGLGTERVESVIKSAFPDIRVLRWDADTASGKQSEAIILNQFKQHQSDVLIGTQMLAKGLDLPLVTLVGVILADIGLGFPDYRTAERAFQILTQVAGRAGRSHLGGKVILQTFQPDHYAIRYAAQHDFLGFYQEEISNRRRLQYPPFVKLIRLETRSHHREEAHQEALALADEIQGVLFASGKKAIQVVGPTPPFFAKQRGYYRWQILIKGNAGKAIVDIVNKEKWRIAVDPPNLL